MKSIRVSPIYGKPSDKEINHSLDYSLSLFVGHIFYIIASNNII